MEHLPTWIEYYDSWHEFYLMAGTAAVTLAGLLFVALSLHVDELIHETREHLLALARGIQFSFIMVLVLSLMMLVPYQTLKLAAGEMMIVGVIFFGFTMRLVRWRPKVEHAGFSAGTLRRRMLLPLIAYAMVVLTGFGLLSTGEPQMMHLAIGAVCMVLGNGAGASWDLLVRVAKIKKDAETA